MPPFQLGYTFFTELPIFYLLSVTFLIEKDLSCSVYIFLYNNDFILVNR